MELLERYLQAVGEYLPVRTKADTLAELRENLLAEMDAQEEELGRALTTAEIAEVLARHGHPMMVASRYLPQQHLIGPGLFPIYWFTLKKSFPLVVLAYTVVQLLQWAFQGWQSFDVGSAIVHLAGVTFTFVAWMTLGFGIFEYAQGRYFANIKLPSRWNPNDLPPLNAKVKRPSLANGVADVIVSSLGLVWLLAIPYKPYLLLGPMVGHVREMPFGLTPEWHIFYWQIMFLLAVQLVLKTIMVFLRRARRWRQGFDVIVKTMGILIIAVMVQVRTYMVPGTTAGAMSMNDLSTLNALINVGFKVALAVSVLSLLWDIWKMVVSSHEHRAGCVTVL